MDDDLIIRFLRGHATPDEARRLETWRAADAASERLFQAVAATWRVTGAREVGPVPTARLLAAARAAGGCEAAVSHPRWLRFRIPLAAAAGLTIVIAVARLLEGAGGETYRAGATASTLTLPDGSYARITAGSHLRYRERGSAREVQVTGRAYLAVHHDAKRPFVARAGRAVATVLGTRFALDVEPRGTRVVVAEGRVRVAAGESQVEVTAGRGVTIGPDASLKSDTVPDIWPTLAWTGDALFFQHTPLTAVAGELSVRFGRVVIVGDSAFGRRTVTGSFAGASFADVVAGICEVVAARCTVRGDSAWVRP